MPRRFDCHNVEDMRDLPPPPAQPDIYYIDGAADDEEPIGAIARPMRRLIWCPIYWAGLLKWICRFR